MPCYEDEYLKYNFRMYSFISYMFHIPLSRNQSSELFKLCIFPVFMNSKKTVSYEKDSDRIQIS